MYNLHWEGPLEIPAIKRDAFSKLWSYLEYRLVVALVGPRRVGKTTLMKQAINELIARGVPPKHIYYFSYDDEIKKPAEIIEEWRRAVGKPIKGNFYLFLDEVQQLPNWTGKIKALYDQLNIHIVISGSISLRLFPIGLLAGRLVEIEVPPLTFPEYMRFKGYNECNEAIYQEYMLRQLPFLALYPIESQDYIKSIVDKVLYGDIVRIKGDPELAHQLFRIILKQPGQIIKTSDLAHDLGVNRNKVSEHLRLLEEAFLIRKLYNYSRNPRKSEVRAKKYYPFYTTLHTYAALPEFSWMVETEAAFQLNAQYFYYERGREVDFVDEDWALECKMKKRIRRQELRTLLSLPQPKKCVLTYSETEVEGVEKITLCDLPLQKCAKFAQGMSL